MRIFKGKGVGTGIEGGLARWIGASDHGIVERRIGEGEVGAELRRFDAAVEATDAAMERIAVQAPGSELSQELVDVHRLILGSPTLTDGARSAIGEQRVGAEWAVSLVLDELRRAFAGIDDERLRARFADVEAVADDLVQVLVHGRRRAIDESFRGAVAVGLELSALEALELHRVGVAALATEHGGPSSHVAIVARTLGIPYVFGIQGLLAAVRSGEALWVDGVRGDLVASPDPATLRDLQDRRRALETDGAAEADAGRAACFTKDATHVSVGANVESADEVTQAMDAGADEIGLVRTELLYLAAGDLPTEDEQYEDAVAILRAARGRPVTFRTLDLAGDKQPAGIHLGSATNPALGLRGIRFSLQRPDLLRAQLRALYRAAAVGPVRILLPMITTADEVIQCRVLCRAVCSDLAADGVRHDTRVPLGAMIETPSAALTTDHVADACDFLSVGTNDLLQYAFAADRQSEEVAYLYQPLHPAMVRLLASVFAAARRAGRPVSVCGDMAADTRCTALLVGLGLRSFSVPGRSVASVKAAVRRTEVRACEHLAQDAGELRTQADVLARSERAGRA